jgi:REP element-mobilizing transposase RayT
VDTRLYTGVMIKGRPPRLTQVFHTYDPPLYLVTICTLHRRPFPSAQIVNSALVAYAMRAADFNVRVGRYVVMPDHIHLFVQGGDQFILGEWVKGLKRSIFNAHPEPRPAQLWQPGFFDHLLRSAESYSQKWNYVLNNPVRAGLVARAEDWPYSGEIVSLEHT